MILGDDRVPASSVTSTDSVPHSEVGSSLLRHPSPELSRLISAHGSLSKGERNFQWPVLAFVIQHHDLEGLEVAMKHALRKSACRVFAMEVQLSELQYFLQSQSSVVL